MANPDYQDREAFAVKRIKDAIPSSLKKNMLKQSEGFFCELYENDEVFPNHYMACAIDGVGTKLILAQAMKKYDTVGIDLVAMSANDLSALGKVSPFLFIDYLAAEEKVQSEGYTHDIVKGIVNGLNQCESSDILSNNIHINFGKGETASVDELMSGPLPGYGFDIAAGIIGFVEKKNLSLEVKPGMVIIAIPSSGLHSNGYTDARHILLNGDFETRSNFKLNYSGKHSLTDKFDNTTIGLSLLTPTRIYTREINKVASKYRVIGVNNTGYGLKNLNRLKGNHEFIITDPLTPLPIFDLLQKESGLDEESMYRKFNMGMGFFIVANEKDVSGILNIIKDAKVVGRVSPAQQLQTRLILNNKEILFKGY